MKILIWATTLQADVLALTQELDRRGDVRLLVVTRVRDAYQREPFARHCPLRCPILATDDPGTPAAVRRFAADLVVADNHMPEFDAAPRLCSMWHGLGWKARPVADLRDYRRHVQRLTGADPCGPNARFVAQCYGEPDRRWRVSSWQLAAQNCETVGMAFSDLLRNPPYTRRELAGHYRIDVASRPTLLLSLTWHYGRMFPGSWRPGWIRASAGFETDLALLRRLFEQVREDGANVLFCLHDKQRYERHYLEALTQLAAGFPHVQLKHKCEHPDNLADLVVADAMVTNLSSFVTFHYVSGRPSVHICPPQEGQVTMARLRGGKLTTRRADADGPAWMTPPDDNGGLSARSPEELFAAVRRALHEPDCCRERARTWLERHVHGLDGRTSPRFADMLLARFGGAQDRGPRASSG